ncbi:MAG: hypothetical protein R3E68_00800 [Burkholderiaceae bacterium]
MLRALSRSPASARRDSETMVPVFSPCLSTIVEPASSARGEASSRRALTRGRLSAERVITFTTPINALLP